MADSYIQLPPDSTGKKLDTDELTVSAQLVQRQRVLAIPPRSDQVPGRASTVAVNTLATGDLVVRANSVGKVFYVTSLHVSIVNTALSLAEVRLTDHATVPSSGALKMNFLVPAAIAGGVAPNVDANVAFPIEPLRFTNGVAIDVVSGTVSVSVTAVGYEE